MKTTTPPLAERTAPLAPGENAAPVLSAVRSGEITPEQGASLLSIDVATLDVLLAAYVEPPETPE